MRCRWDDGRGSSGEGDEVIAGQMGVLGSGLGNGAVAEEGDREADTVTVTNSSYYVLLL